MLETFKRYFVPASLEQSLGLGYLLLSITFIPRPFMAGVTNLLPEYGIYVELSVRAVGAMLALMGGILIYRKRLRRLAFVPFFLPIPLYTVALALYTAENFMVGATGTFFGAGLSLCIGWMYGRRATTREREGISGRS